MTYFNSFEQAQYWVENNILEDFRQEVLAKIQAYHEENGEYAFS